MSWPAAALLAPIAVAQPVNTDVYGSYKQTVTAPPGENELGACGVKAAMPESSPTVVTPRPTIGWNATPSGELPFWRPVGIAVDPDSGRTALAVRGKASAVTTGGGGTTPTETPPPAAASDGASTALPAPTPTAKKPVLKCKRGFLKKTVRGKAKCVKKAKKGKKKH